MVRSLGGHVLRLSFDFLETNRLGSCKYGLRESLASTLQSASQTPIGSELDKLLTKFDEYIDRKTSGPRMQRLEVMLVTSLLPRAITLKVRARTEQGPFLESWFPDAYKFSSYCTPARLRKAAGDWR